MLETATGYEHSANVSPHTHVCRTNHKVVPKCVFCIVWVGHLYDTYQVYHFPLDTAAEETDIQ